MMTADDALGAFLYGLELLHVDNRGLVPHAHDEDDLNAIGAASVLAYRIASRGDTPLDLALARLAVLTGGLLASQWQGSGETIVRKWLIARAELLELELAGNC